MEGLFLQILNMSLVASVVIIVVLLLRLPLKKAPKSISYALWSVVLFRLICPFSFESIFSLLPSAKPLPSEILTAPSPVINSGFPVLDQAITLPAPALGDSVNPMQALLFIAAIVWIIGVAVLFIYSIIAYLLLKHRVATAMLIKDNVYECDTISSPFVLGIFKPKIYLPLGLSINQMAYIIKHEQTHIKRLDILIKPVAYFSLCVHWFNPLCWLAFIVMSKDMELSCDETVIKAMGTDIKCDYSSSLLSLATEHKMLNGCPLAFCENNLQARIKNVLSYKKPSLWVIIAAVTVVSLVGAGLFLNPKAASSNKFNVVAVQATTSGELLSDAEIDTISRKVFANASIVFDRLYFSPMQLERDEEDFFTQDETTWYRLKQLNTFAEYENLCKSVFSKDFYDNTILPAAENFLLEHNGKLYQSTDRIGGGGGYTQLTMYDDKIAVISKEQGRLVVAANTKGLVPTENGYSDGILKYTLVKENENWVLYSFYGDSAATVPYTVSVMENGDVQLSISNATEFVEFGEKNEGFAYYEKAKNQIHIGITTAIGQPVATEDSPVGSLAGAKVTYDIDLLSTDKPLNTEFTEGGSNEKIKLDISDDRLLEIALRFYEIIEQEAQKSVAVSLLRWAQSLSVNDIASIELIMEPSSVGKRYKKYSANEFAEIVALINESNGEALPYNENLAGSIQTLYITQNDGNMHTITNGGGTYLIIDGQYYEGAASLLDKWAFEGNAPVPASFNTEETAAITVNEGQLSPDDFVAKIVQSFQIKEGVARFIIPNKMPSGYTLSQLSILVSGTMPMGDDTNMSLHAFEKEQEGRKWQLGQEYIERMLDANVPDGTEVYINVSLMEKDDATSKHFAGGSKIFPLREDHFTPNVKATANTVTFTNKFNDTLKLSISLPSGFTMKAPVAGDASENSKQGNVVVYNGETAVGTIHYNDFKLERVEGGDIPYMAVYNSIMMGSGASWDSEYTPLYQTKDTCTAICKPWHRIDVPGVSGAAQANAVAKGILSYDANLLKYVAIYLDDQAVTQAQLTDIAKSVKLSK